MKRKTPLFIALSCLLISLVISICTYEVYTKKSADSAYAVILDTDGNIIKNLDVEVSIKEVPNPTSAATTFTALTYTASDDTNIMATGTITWYDAWGPDNTLISVEGGWLPSGAVLSERSITYGAKDIFSKDTTSPFVFENWVADTFHIPQSSVTGYQFYLQTTAKINETGNTVAIMFNTTAKPTESSPQHPTSSRIESHPENQNESDNLGITMKILEASPTGLVIECTQSGGAPQGELSTTWYVLRDENGYMDNIAHTSDGPGFEHPIEKESTTLLTIDWTEEYGELPEGTYKLVLFVEDVYGESTGHPFEDDYRTVAKYDPIFTIP